MKKTPLTGTQTPSSVSQTRRSAPQTPSSVPQTPSSVPQTPSSVSQTRRSALQTPSSVPQTQRTQSQTPLTETRTSTTEQKTLRTIKQITHTIALCILFIPGNTSAQKNIGGREMRKANLLFERKDYVNAFKRYLKVYKRDSLSFATPSADGSDKKITDMNYRMGICAYNIRDKKMEALPYFEKCSVQQYPEALFYLGNLYHLQAKFDEAIENYEAYKKTGSKENDSTYIQMLIAKSVYAKEMMKHPLNIVIHNMGSMINSAYPDYVPLLTADGLVMIFTSRRANSTGGLKDLNGDYMEDVYVSSKNENEWTEATGISNNINTDMHDACVALSPDGQQLIVYRPSEDLITGDLYLSKFTGRDWSEPKLLGSDINMDNTIEASATFSPDNNVLIFSSDRPGGFGGRDLYKVVKLPNEEWSKARNLGNVINTAYDEDGPFLHVDGKTLYFSSKAHNNMGGYDIFKSTLNEDQTWTTPQNMEYPINTVNDDIYFVLSVNGDKGYFSSKGEFTYGGIDIYSIDIPEQNFGLAIVNCRVMGTDNLPTQATITLTENERNVPPRMFTSSKETGKFIMVVSPGRKYKMSVQSEGYELYTKELQFNSNDFEDNITKLEISLTKIKNQ